MFAAQSQTPSQVRLGWLQQHHVASYPHIGLHIVSMALGPGRMWQHCLTPLARSIDNAVRSNVLQSNLSQSNSARSNNAIELVDLLEQVRTALRAGRGMLVESVATDVCCVAVHVVNSTVLAASTGGTRAYVARPKNNVPERITPRDAPPGGLMTGVIAQCRTEIAPGDLIMLGSDPTFSTSSIERFQKRFLQYRSDPKPQSQSSLASWVGELTSSHEREGTGSGAVLIG